MNEAAKIVAPTTRLRSAPSDGEPAGDAQLPADGDQTRYREHRRNQEILVAWHEDRRLHGQSQIDLERQRIASGHGGG